ncbi:MAG: hypothetical protein ACTHW7_14170, partial [Actinomycetaceae bacterium]
MGGEGVPDVLAVDRVEVELCRAAALAARPGVLQHGGAHRRGQVESEALGGRGTADHKGYARVVVYAAAQTTSKRSQITGM